MAQAYQPKQIEPKWQEIWEREAAFAAENHSKKPKYYALIEFPYPSGVGLHVGHPRPYTAMDTIARKRRMEGYNVLFPIGWDAFGLPTENYAIANKIHPAKVTERNVARFRQQLKMLGFSLDWSREVDTTDPNYYKWTQWIFLQLFKKGLAYKAEIPINFCTCCKIGLANEEVVGGVCERCGGEVVRKVKSQWMLSITKYAQRLLDGLEQVDYIEAVRAQQKHWIGRSEGASIRFALNLPQAAQAIEGLPAQLEVFTTRPDTLFGATYMVISPEHPLVEALLPHLDNAEAVRAYGEASARKSDFERTELAKDKTGVALSGVTCTNPATGQPIPVWISDYVLMGYGTGAIMAVPGHDERDWAFARAFGLPIIEVVAGGNIQEGAYADIEEGVLVNSGFLNGLSVADAKAAMNRWLEEQALGEAKIQYKLRDWVFSRQRYWGEPIPLVHCDCCGWVPVDEADLPLRLPDVEAYEPTDTGESPLAKLTDWVSTTCPKCGAPAQRETDTMPNWAGSSWYFLRYCDPACADAPASKEALDYWMPVDWYNGGMEHVTLHMLYSRFWHQFLYDIGVVSCPEPYIKRTTHGMVLGEDGEKMSKSRGNVVNPDEMVDKLGADAMRVYEMFLGAFDQAIPWSTAGAMGCRRFLERVWRLGQSLRPEAPGKQRLVMMHQAIRKVTDDIERMKFNTAIAQLMSWVNAMYEQGASPIEYKNLLLLLAPFAPHICEELWEQQGQKGRIYNAAWPAYDEAYLQADEAEIAVQVNGKVKARIMLPADVSEDDAKQAILAHADIAPLLEGKALRKFIFVPGRNANLVVG